MPKGKGYGYKEGMMGNPMKQNNRQPGGGAMRSGSAGSFGKYPGSSKTVDGVTFDAGCNDACTNRGRNYNEVGSKARKFGTGGAM